MQGALTRVGYGVFRSTKRFAHEIEKEPATLRGMLFDLPRAIEEFDKESHIHAGAGQTLGYFDEVKPADLMMQELLEEATPSLLKQTSFLR